MFFQTTATAGLAMLPGSVPFADSEPQATALPRSIAALKSMKDQAKPIGPAERQARQEKARALMEANDLDAILLMEGTSLNYFTGMQWWGGERMFAMVLPAKGTAFYYARHLKKGVHASRFRKRRKVRRRTCASGRKMRSLPARRAGL